ncbi:MAG TPA: NAD-dependent succinate-semialdehyde dehydrogenase [Bryobacteraceae bacterium]|jgi:succinate-semialdehyde dehydrogenase/glutarate-semialdehyde dehydrogenase
MIRSVNPYTGKLLQSFEPHSDAEVERRVQLAWDTFHTYRRAPFAERAEGLHCAAQILESNKLEFGRMMTEEMGKTLASAQAEAAKCASVCRYYADRGEKALAPIPIASEAADSRVAFQPIGPVLAVMPWNFPFWQVFRFAAPALMAGNTGLLKHASNVPRCALAIEDIFRRAGFPEGAFQTLLIESSRVEALLADDRIAAATLTGSEPAGRAVASQAGRHIKKTVLELGGSDPFIVCPSANLDDAVSTAVKARTINSGQSCIAAKRFIVLDAIYPEFESRFVASMQSLKIGDPLEEATQVGPLATEQILRDLESQVDRAVQAGAKVLTGGSTASGHRNTYQPTVLAGVPRDSDIFHEEFFGPVAMLFRVRTIEEAIGLANDSPFGLGASAWTNDPAEHSRFAADIEAGAVFFNAMVASDPRLPFGGIKRSGYGRELSEFGIREFTNVKTIYTK